MSAPAKLNLRIYQGATFNQAIRWESSTRIYLPIQSITKAAPMVVSTVDSHTVPAGWRVKLSNIQGMKEANTGDSYITVSAVGNKSLEFNNINSIGYSTYTSGGVVEYNQPVDLQGFTARMQLREKATSDSVILELTTENGRLAIDNTTKQILISLNATITSSLDFKHAVYSLELEKNSVVTQLVQGTVLLETEVTK